jgi:hypothetical protein
MVRDGWYALLISILRDCNPDHAFDLYYLGFKTRPHWGKEKITRFIVCLRDRGYTNKYIGDMLGLTMFAVSKRYNKYKRGLKVVNNGRGQMDKNIS